MIPCKLFGILAAARTLYWRKTTEISQVIQDDDCGSTVDEGMLTKRILSRCDPELARGCWTQRFDRKALFCALLTSLVNRQWTNMSLSRTTRSFSPRCLISICESLRTPPPGSTFNRSLRANERCFKPLGICTSCMASTISSGRYAGTSSKSFAKIQNDILVDQDCHNCPSHC